MLQIEHLTKTYGEKKAVDDLSLHILPGEIYGFIGRHLHPHGPVGLQAEDCLHPGQSRSL